MSNIRGPAPPIRASGGRAKHPETRRAAVQLRIDPSSHVVGASGGPWKHPETRRTEATRPKPGGFTVCGGILVGARVWKGLYGPLTEGP